MKYIAYHRVSTQQQGNSGLGLEAQVAIIKQFTPEVLAEYTEVESGKLKNRPQLTAALAHSKRANATLVVAKLDRLARNVAFVSALMESGVEFVACDNPHANRLTLHILAAVAEEEARAISVRTKAALAAYKARGGKLGSARPGHWDGRERGWRRASKVSAENRKRATEAAYSSLVPTLKNLAAQYAGEPGPVYQRLADWLNENGHYTIKGKPFSQSTVWRILQRAA